MSIFIYPVTFGLKIPKKFRKEISPTFKKHDSFIVVPRVFAFRNLTICPLVFHFIVTRIFNALFKYFNISITGINLQIIIKKR